MQVILDQLKLQADVVEHKTNGIVSRYFIRLRPGGVVKRIENRLNEIALGLKSHSIPLIRLIPNKGLISLETLAKEMETVPFNSISQQLYRTNLHLPIILGMNYDGSVMVDDLTIMPHMLVAGTTGSGKSIFLHSLICSLIKQNNSQVQLVMIDPKNVEFSYYKNIKQLSHPIVNYVEDACDVLSDLIQEMDKRFKIMEKASVNNIQQYNNKKRSKMSYIVVVIDEFADLMQRAKKEFQTLLGRLAQKSRACGIHIVIATQRPSADVITGIIKANCPSVVSFKVTSAVNSRVILDENGAEKLLGKGDALIKSTNFNVQRFKGAYISTDEIIKICNENEAGWIRKATRWFQW